MFIKLQFVVCLMKLAEKVTGHIWNMQIIQAVLGMDIKNGIKKPEPPTMSVWTKQRMLML